MHRCPNCGDNCYCNYDNSDVESVVNGDFQCEHCESEYWTSIWDTKNVRDVKWKLDCEYESPSVSEFQSLLIKTAKVRK